MFWCTVMNSIARAARNSALRRVVVGASRVGFDGWGRGDVTIESCATDANGADFDRLFADASPCDAVGVRPSGPWAGADGQWFTDDDPWLVPGGATLD